MKNESLSQASESQGCSRIEMEISEGDTVDLQFVIGGIIITKCRI
jgi:hypothetical protein